MSSQDAPERPSGLDPEAVPAQFGGLDPSLADYVDGWLRGDLDLAGEELFGPDTISLSSPKSVRTNFGPHEELPFDEFLHDDEATGSTANDTPLSASMFLPDNAESAGPADSDAPSAPALPVGGDDGTASNSDAGAQPANFPTPPLTIDRALLGALGEFASSALAHANAVPAETPTVSSAAWQAPEWLTSPLFGAAAPAATTQLAHDLALLAPGPCPFPALDFLPAVPATNPVGAAAAPSLAPEPAWTKRIRHSRKNKGTGQGTYAPPFKPGDILYRTGRGQEVRLTYTLYGEFNPHHTFDSDSLLGYLQQGRPGGAGGRPPTLWVQNQPAQYNVRYPRGRESFKCRFHDCPVSRRTIHKGMWRVAFDEFPGLTGQARDPFWNAGYAHLYCLEQRADLHDLVRRGVAQADCRSLDYEDRNPMALEGPLLDTFRAWRTAREARHQRHCAAWRAAGLAGPPPPRRLAPDDFLYYRLTRRRLELDAPAREHTREQRDRAAAQKGSETVSTDKYMGDLALYARLVARRRARRLGRGGEPDDAGDEAALAGAPGQCPAGAGRKRGREGDDETSEAAPSSWAQCSGHPAKRPRVEASAPLALPQGAQAYVAASLSQAAMQGFGLQVGQAPFPVVLPPAQALGPPLWFSPSVLGGIDPAQWLPGPSAYPDPLGVLGMQPHPFGEDVSAAFLAATGPTDDPELMALTPPPPSPPPLPRPARARGAEEAVAGSDGRARKRRRSW